MRARYRWELALVGVCAIWGWTFVLVRDAVARTPPFLFLTLRFAVAAVVLASVGAFSGLRRADVRVGVVTGCALFAGYATQTVGQQYTTPSNAGFITGLFVVFTPLLGALVLRALPSFASVAGAALATGGLFLLAAKEGLRLARGDVLILVTAVAFAAHILLIGRLGRTIPAKRFAAVQIATACVASAIWSGVAERVAPGSSGTVWTAIVVTGVLATAAAFLIQTRAQQEIPPVRTAVILTAEPVFAGLFGFLLAGDRLGARGYAGAALIVAGILAAELFAPDREAV